MAALTLQGSNMKEEEDEATCLGQSRGSSTMTGTRGILKRKPSTNESKPCTERNFSATSMFSTQSTLDYSSRGSFLSTSSSSSSASDTDEEDAVIRQGSTSTYQRTRDMMRKCAVSFGSAQVRHHARILGDHPSCCDDLPLGLGWERIGQDVVIDLAHDHKDSIGEEQSDRKTLRKKQEEKDNNLLSRQKNSDASSKEDSNGHQLDEKKFAKAKRLSYDERRDLLIRNTEHCLRTRSSIRRSDSRRIRQSVMKAAILKKQDLQVTLKTTNKQSCDDGENACYQREDDFTTDNCFLGILGIRNLCRFGLFAHSKNKMQWEQTEEGK